MLRSSISLLLFPFTWVFSSVVLNITALECTRPNKIALSYFGDGPGLPDIYKALVTCPNITSLDIRLEWLGCVAPDDPWSFDFQPCDRFPALRKLSLTNYDFVDRDRWHQFKRSWTYGLQNFAPREDLKALLGWMVPYIPLPGLPRFESSLEQWQRAMDWTQLSELNLGETQSLFFTQMRSELPSIRALHMTDFPREAISFLNTIPPLENLGIKACPPTALVNNTVRPYFHLDEILARHGPTLQSLELHQPEDSTPTRRPVFSPAEILVIHAFCPHLTHLGLDIDRNGTWPNATLDALVANPHLTSLTLGLEMGMDLHSDREMGEYGYNPEGLDGVGPFREPRMSLEVAEALFENMRERKVGEELRELRIDVGGYSEVGYSGPLYFPSWSEGRERLFVCEVDGEGEDGDLMEGGSCRMVGGGGDSFGFDDDDGPGHKEYPKDQPEF